MSVWCHWITGSRFWHLCLGVRAGRNRQESGLLVTVSIGGWHGWRWQPSAIKNRKTPEVTPADVDGSEGRNQ